MAVTTVKEKPDVVEGIKIIHCNSHGIDKEDDPENFPFKLKGFFRPPAFMSFTFVSIHGGSEEFTVIGKTQEALEEFIEVNKFDKHPRLNRLTITNSEGEIIKEIPPRPQIKTAE
ncbi:hypothetical protein ACFL24_01560 [Patescibacteria group bacterium]